MIDDDTTDAHLQSFVETGHLDGSSPEVMSYKPEVVEELAKRMRF